MKQKIFTRVDGALTRQTLAIYRENFFEDKKQGIVIIALISIGHLTRYVIIPLLISFIIQSLITDPRDAMTPSLLAAGILVTMLISAFCNNRGFDNLFRHEEGVQTKLLNDALEHLMSQSYQFFSDRKVGTLSGDLMNYSRSYLNFLDAYFLHTNHLVISFIASLVVIGVLSPILLIPALTVFAVLIGHSIHSTTKRAVYRNKRKELTSQLAGTLADIMGNQQLVRVFAREQLESKRIMSDRDEIEKVALKEIHLVMRESITRQFLVYGFQLLVIGVFIWLGTNQIISIAALVFTFSYLNRTTDTIFGLSGIIRSLEQAFLDAAPMVRMLSVPVTISDAENAKTLKVTKGLVELRSVNFAYVDQGEDAVFENLSITIPQGQRIGLAGRSGGGKSTLTKLLLRFVDVDDGEIVIDDQNIAHVSQSSLRSAIAYVPQDPFLFHRSLRENIAYGKPDATNDEIVAAAKKAFAWDFISKQPNGLDTVVGERGVKLSGGQRQRIAISRAILKDAPILILDEATSALDSESEVYIQKALAELMKDRTSIVIAHRLSTIAKLDRIIVLDEGKIIEDGSHAELLARGGTYAKLWRHQSGGFIEE